MARDKNNLVKIPGELHSTATGNITVGTDEVFDYDSSTRQDSINHHHYNASLKSRWLHEVFATTRTLVETGNQSQPGGGSVVSDSSTVVRSTRETTASTTASDSSVVSGPTSSYDSSANQTTFAWVTTRDVVRDANDYTFAEAVASVPTPYRNGGLKLTFKSDTSLKYVEWFLEKSSWSTNIGDWVGVDDEIVKGSNNLLKSGDVYDVYNNTKDIKRTETSIEITTSIEIQDNDNNTVVNVTDDCVEVTGELKLNSKNVATEDELDDKQDVIEQLSFSSTELENSNIVIADDYNNIVVNVTDDGVGVFGTLTLNSKNVATEDELDGKQDIVEQISFSSTGGEASEIVIADDNDNEVVSISVAQDSDDDYQSWTNDDGSDEYARIDSNGVKAKQFYKLNGDVVGEQAYTIVVDPNGRGDYTNIVDAMNNAGDTQSRHVTIIINQGDYDMPPKVSYDAPYVESNRNLTLKGVNRNKCVLRCNIGFYDYTIGTDCATLRLCGNVTIENLTIISSNEEYDNKIGAPGYVTQRTDRKAAYCIHLDQGRQDGDEIVVKNCTLINYQMACIGFGTRKNSVIRVEDCYAQCEQAAQDSDANSYGTIWGHSGGNTPGQRLEVLRCQLVHKTGNRAIRYSYAEESSTELECSACFICNAVKTQNVENALLINGFPEGTFILDPLSFGNKCSAMNA